jgi:hypothetical protein
MACGNDADYVRFSVADDFCRDAHIDIRRESQRQTRPHRQKGFSLEPGPQSGFGHYQAQEVRTLAWLKSTTIF